MSNIKLITLGGVRENGKNLYIAEVNDSIFVLDAGLKYPENEQLGVDVVIPNMDYLFENSDRIAGVFLTHGHADAIGALPYLLAEAKVPVFGSELTVELAKLFVKSNDSVKKFNDFHVIDANSEIDFGGTVVSFFQTTHSIPESLGIVIKTPEGNIVYTGDFKFDQTASESYATDFGRLAEIGREGVLALLSDSANADSKIQVASEQEVGDEILDTIGDWDGRVIVAAVASNLSRIQQVFDAAAETGRRVVLTGFDVENIVRTGIRLNKLSLANEKLLIKPKEMSRFEDHELIILETGRMGEPINGLRKMSIGRHRYVEIKDGDLVYIVTTPSIAKEAVMARVENMVYQAGGVVKQITQSLRVSGHGNARDLQLMINLLRPNYLFPIQGNTANWMPMHGLLWKWGFCLKISSFRRKAPSWNMTMVTSFLPVVSLLEMSSSMGMPLEMLGMLFSVTGKSFQKMGSLLWLLRLTVVRNASSRRQKFTPVALSM